MTYVPAEDRYDRMTYKRCGRSGLKLPLISLGLWHNWGGVEPLENGRAMLRRAFDLGITHFDLANNYGPPYGSAEESFGRIFRKDFAPLRDELVISTKAGWDMWPGPYGDWGSRKYLIASLDQSLERMGLDYVDIFYHHRPDPETPLEETMGALDFAVRSGRALYAGISQYPPERTREAARILRNLGTPCLIHQPRYHMFDRWIENGLLDVLDHEGIGCIVFSPLAQGLLTNKYLKGIPDGFARGQAIRLPRRRRRHRGGTLANTPAECARGTARPVPRPDGRRLGPAPPGGDLGPDRRQQGRPDRRDRGGPAIGLHGRRAGGDRQGTVLRTLAIEGISRIHGV